MPILTESQARFLAEARVARLATADAGGRPHVIPVCFIYADLGYGGEAIYIALDQKPKTAELTRLRRVRNILANPQASLVVDHYDENWRIPSVTSSYPAEPDCSTATNPKPPAP